MDTGTESRTFKIGRGTKQGDPLSPKLFNAVLEEAIGGTVKSWEERGYGVRFDNGRFLTNLRFADDILLVASSAGELQNMLEEMTEDVQKVGLELHYGKTVVLNNNAARKPDRRRTAQIGEREVPVLEEGRATKYLGRALRLDCHNDAEIEFRINVAWQKFMAAREELCNKKYPLRQRLRLFGASVSRSFLYGSGTWTLTAERERKIRSAQRRMLRAMVGQGRQLVPKNHTDEDSESEEWELHSSEDEEEAEDSAKEEMEIEPWHQWVQRVTKLALKEMQKAGVSDWVCAVRRQIWRLAGHIARREDDRWSTAMLDWQPVDGRRPHRRPTKRWEEDIIKVFQAEAAGDRQAWRLVAPCRSTWHKYEDKFATREVEEEDEESR